MRPPAFQFYPDDFLAGTFHMSQKDVGAYIRLLCVQWNNGGIPCEPEKISRLAGGKVSEEVIAKFQKCDDGLLRNQRLEKERGKQEQYRALQRDKGVKSAQARAAAAEQRLNRGSNPVGTEGQPARKVRLEPKGNSPSPSPSPNNTSAEEPAREEASGEPAKERPRNLVWDAICELFALDPGGMTEAEKGKIGKVVKQIKAASPDVTRDEIRLRAAEYRRRFPKASFTPTALLSHWSSLAQQELPQAKSEAWKVKNIYDCTR